MKSLLFRQFRFVTVCSQTRLQKSTKYFLLLLIIPNRGQNQSRAIRNHCGQETLCNPNTDNCYFSGFIRSRKRDLRSVLDQHLNRVVKNLIAEITRKTPFILTFMLQLIRLTMLDSYIFYVLDSVLPQLNVTYQDIKMTAIKPRIFSCKYAKKIYNTYNLASKVLLC